MNIKCPDCGFSNIEKSKYCQNCGYTLPPKNSASENNENKSLHEQIEGIDDIIFKPQKKNGSLTKVVLILFSIIGVIFVSLIVWYSIFPEDATTDSVEQSSTKTSDEGQWKTFNSTEHGFKINFPADYEVERIPEETLDNGVTYSGMQYLSSPSDNEVYIAQVADYDITPSDYDNEIGLEGVVNGTVEGAEGILTNSSFIKFKGFDAIQFTFTTKENYSGKGMALIKDDLRNIKMYMMMVLNDTAKFGGFDTFINSFEFR